VTAQSIAPRRNPTFENASQTAEVALPERGDETVGKGCVDEVLARRPFFERPTSLFGDHFESAFEGLQCFIESLLGILLPVVLVRFEEFFLRASKSFRIEEMKGR